MDKKTTTRAKSPTSPLQCCLHIAHCNSPASASILPRHHCNIVQPPYCHDTTATSVSLHTAATPLQHRSASILPRHHCNIVQPPYCHVTTATSFSLQTATSPLQHRSASRLPRHHCNIVQKASILAMMKHIFNSPVRLQKIIRRPIEKVWLSGSLDVNSITPQSLHQTCFHRVRKQITWIVVLCVKQDIFLDKPP